jgi:hypothetical protein
LRGSRTSRRALFANRVSPLTNAGAVAAILGPEDGAGDGGPDRRQDPDP